MPTTANRLQVIDYRLWSIGREKNKENNYD